MIHKILLILIFSFNIFANDTITDSLNLAKIKKSIKKEEEVASAYKQYLTKLGKNPSSIQDLINKSFLPKGFSKWNPYGREIKILDSTKAEISNSIPKAIKNKFNIYDYYQDTNHRENTYVSAKKSSNIIKIKLNRLEQFINKNPNTITTKESKKANKYLLKNNALTYYDGVKLLFSYNEDRIILSKNGNFIENEKTKTSLFKSFLDTQKLTFAGQKILQEVEKNGKIQILEFINIDENTVARAYRKSAVFEEEANLLQLQDNTAIINNDLYVWGDSARAGFSSGKYINVLVRLKSKIYPENISNIENNTTKTNIANTINTNKYFSTVFRPSFTDAFSFQDLTCAISKYDASTKKGGALYCTYNTNGILEKSQYFDGSSEEKALSKVVSKGDIWFFLTRDGNLYEVKNPTIDTTDFNSNKIAENIVDIVSNSSLSEKLIINKQGKVYFVGLDNKEKQTILITNIILPKAKKLFTSHNRYLVQKEDNTFHLVHKNSNTSSPYIQTNTQANFGISDLKDVKWISLIRLGAYYINKDFKFVYTYPIGSYVNDGITQTNTCNTGCQKDNLPNGIENLYFKTAKVYQNTDKNTFGVCATSCEIVKDTAGNDILDKEGNKQCGYPYNLYCWGDIQRFLPKAFTGNSNDIITGTKDTNSTAQPFTKISGFGYNFKLK